MNKAIRKKILNSVLLTVLICALIFLYVFFPVKTFVYWNNVAVAGDNAEVIIKIGEWLDEDNPDVNRFNDVVEELTNADPLLSSGITNLYILGVNDGNNATQLPENPILPGDVLVWQRENGSIIAAQITGSAPEGQMWADVLNSWDALETALSDMAYPVNTSRKSYVEGHIYTTAHAPVTYNGLQYLARHNNVTIAPSIGGDWFLLSKFWVNQSYPVGSFVEHIRDDWDTSRHFRKISPADAEPGTFEANGIWEEVPEFNDDHVLPLWYQKTWALNDIVEYNDNYYISVTDNNNEAPGSNSWVLIIRYNPAETVPLFVSGRDYATGDIVRYVNSYGETGYYMATGQGNGSMGSNSWRLLQNWNDVSGVKNWDAYTNYKNATGQYYQHQGKVYRNLKGGNGKPPPQDNSGAWLEIPMWSSIPDDERFVVSRDIGAVCTVVGGNLTVWEISSEKVFSQQSPPGEPSVLTDDWRRVATPCTDSYVYTSDNGALTLWQKTISGSTSEQPGAGEDWRKIDFQTGAKYVYTVNSSGMLSFWYSATETSNRPGSDDWSEVLTHELNIDEYVYIISDDRVNYYKTNCGPAQSVWNEISNAWIGKSVLPGETGIMINHWSSQNFYNNGDIVAYGITGTNTYRYFRLRDGVSAVEAIGRTPISVSGSIYWEPLNTFTL